jgi:hypothetical protein
MGQTAQRTAPRPVTAIQAPPPVVEQEYPVGIASRSASIDQLAPAFVQVQIKLQPIVKNRSADTTKYVTNFADLASILDEVLPLLNDHGLALAQFPSNDGQGRAMLRTYLMHQSGQFISDEQMMAPKVVDPQGLGSAITFARRYAACAILGIRTYDDDGNAGSGHDSNIGQAGPPQQRQARGRQQQPPAPPQQQPPQQDNRPPVQAPPNGLAALGWPVPDEGAYKHKVVSEQISHLKQADPDSPALAEIQGYVKEHRWPMSPDRLDFLAGMLAKAAQTPQEAPQGSGGPNAPADGSSAQDGAQSGQSGPLCPWCDCPTGGSQPSLVVPDEAGKPVTWHAACQMDHVADPDGRPM